MIDKLHERIAEEHRDHEVYLALAEQAEREGHEHEAGVLRDIAHEEEIHGKMLAKILLICKSASTI